jgi:hypothetical protein
MRQSKKMYREISIVAKGDWELVAEFTKIMFDKKLADPGEPTDLAVMGRA